MMNSKDQIIDLIRMVLKRPAMFQVNRVEDLWLILFGYQHALTFESNVEINELLVDFTKFINLCFESTTEYNWDKLIRLHSGSDSHSIQLFEQLFEQFLLEKK